MTLRRRRPTLALALLLAVAIPTTTSAAPWSPTAPGAPAIFELIADPVRPGVVWAGGGPGVLLSEDGGIGWTRRSDGLGFASTVVALAVDPDDPDQLWATISLGEVFRSLDRGHSWRLVPEVGEANDVVFDAAGTLYLGSRDDNSLWVSNDDGATWDVRPVVGQPQSLAPAPTTPGLLLVATRQRVLRTDDGGRTLVDVRASGDRAPLADPLTDGTFYLPATPPQVSLDGGLTWQALGATPFAGGATMAADPSTPGRLFVADRDGRIAESTDGGQSWSARGGDPGLDIPSAANPALLLVEATDRLLLGRGALSNTAGLFAHIDTTTRGDIAVSGAGAFRGVTVGSPADGNEILAAAEDGIHLSGDGGGTWRRAPIGFDGFVPIEVVRGAGGTLLAVLDSTTGNLQTVATSDDDGATWTGRGTPFGVRPQIDDPQPGAAPGVLRVVSNTDDGTSGVFRSDDGGVSWTTELAADRNVILALTASPADPERLWAAGSAGVARKADVDSSWQALGGSPPLVTIAAGANDSLYGLGFDDSIWVSTNGGTTWRSSPVDALVFDLAVSAADGELAALIVGDGHLLVTDDAGRTWNRLPTDLASFPQSLAFGPQARRLWLTTSGSGLFTRLLAVDEPLALQSARFLAEVRWRAFDGSTGTGRAALRTDDTGTYWFFGPENLELMVKVLDGRGVNNHWWVFYGATTNVEFTLTVTDRVTGAQSLYFNPLGTFASFGDTTAFEAIYPAGVAAGGGSTNPGIAPGEPTPQLLLGGGRFRATVTWRDFDGDSGGGLAVPLADDTGAFWFFDDENLELMVKVLDGRPINGRFWVFFGSLSNVAFNLEIEDLETGTIRRYDNPLGTFASVGDVEAF
ncbi:MAG: hypothetical protein AAGC60_20555 [Acidobacteriota bacterium]